MNLDDVERLRHQLDEEDSQPPLDPRPLEHIWKQQKELGDESYFQAQFDFAWVLVKQRQRQHIRRGIQLLQDLVNQRVNVEDCLYFIGLAHYRMQDWEGASTWCDKLLAINAESRQARSLKALAQEQIKRDGLIGLATVTGGVFLAGLTALLLRKK